MRLKIWLLAGLLATAIAVDARAQAPPTDQVPAEGMRRVGGPDAVGTSTNGDVGLWFVPLADTNGRGRWRGSFARTSRNAVQGHLNVADFTGSVSYGLSDRADLFVSWDAVARVDRDLRPLFNPGDAQLGGIDAAAPFARTTWSGNQRADLRVGGKFKLLEQQDGSPASFAIRGVSHLPIGDAENGGGVGALAFDVDAIFSRWVNPRFVLTGTAGASQRNNPKEPVEVHVPPLLDWGAGVGFLPFETLLLHAEVTGEKPFSYATADLDQRLQANDGSISPMHSTVEHHKAIAAGMTWMARSGVFLGAAAKWDFPMRDRPAGTRFADYTDVQVRVGWRPGTGQPTAIARSMPPPSPASAPVAPAATPAAGPEGSGAATADAPAAQTGRREFVFEDVSFDFNRYSLRPEALRILDEAVAAMSKTRTVRMIIEGHTCNIGTAEFNLALGERRAHAVYQYLTAHGISASRLNFVTFGEERPKFDNSREETRRLNRRAAMVVRLENTTTDEP